MAHHAPRAPLPPLAVPTLEVSTPPASATAPVPVVLPNASPTRPPGLGMSHAGGADAQLTLQAARAAHALASLGTTNAPAAALAPTPALASASSASGQPHGDRLAACNLLTKQLMKQADFACRAIDTASRGISAVIAERVAVCRVGPRQTTFAAPASASASASSALDTTATVGDKRKPDAEIDRLTRSAAKRRAQPANAFRALPVDTDAVTEQPVHTPIVPQPVPVARVPNAPPAAPAMPVPAARVPDTPPAAPAMPAPAPAPAPHASAPQEPTSRLVSALVLALMASRPLVTQAVIEAVHHLGRSVEIHHSVQQYEAQLRGMARELQQVDARRKELHRTMWVIQSNLTVWRQDLHNSKARVAQHIPDAFVAPAPSAASAPAPAPASESSASASSSSAKFILIEE